MNLLKMILLVNAVMESGVLLIWLVIAVFYLLTLMRALQKCAPQSRTMRPGMVWLLLIPFFNTIWSFFVVTAMSHSLANEFRLRGMVNAPPEPGELLGIAMSVCWVLGATPFLGFLGSLAGLVLMIMYWVKITEFSRMLDVPPGMGARVSGVPGGMTPGV